MEAVGLLAGIAQISVYAINIVSTIQDIRLAIRNGPTLLREKSQQLDVLRIAVERISLSPQVHSKEIEAYLLAIESKILRLHTIIRTRLLRPTDTSVRKLRAAILCVGKNKEVEETFKALQGDCQFLNLYMALPVRGSKEVIERPQNQANDPGTIPNQPSQTFEEYRLERLYRSRTQPGFMQGPPTPPPLERTPRSVSQSFGDIHTSGKGTKMSAGNYTLEAARGGISQQFASLRTEDGASADVGNTITGNESRESGQDGVRNERSSV